MRSELVTIISLVVLCHIHGWHHSNQVSRVDLSWEVLVGTSWYKFAFLEFKCPGALDNTEWLPAWNGTGQVQGSGEKICRQIVKYGWTYNIKYIAACTWDQLVLVHLKEEKYKLVNTTGVSPDPIRVEFSWTNGQAFRNLYVFLKYALRMRLQELGFQLS
jgi:hypothetical protein